MGIEVYQTQLVVRWKSVLQRTTFFFRVDNMSGAAGHRVSSAINQMYFVTIPWALSFQFMFSEEASLRVMSTRQIRPTPGPRANGIFNTGVAPGMLAGSVGTNFELFTIQWKFPGDQTGKHQVRIGPLPQGMFEPDGWNFALLAAAAVFVGHHTTPQTLDTGDGVQGCINHQTSGGTPITNGQAGVPVGRQMNRRPRF